MTIFCTFFDNRSFKPRHCCESHGKHRLSINKHTRRSPTTTEVPVEGRLEGRRTTSLLRFQTYTPKKNACYLCGFFHRNQANINYYSLGVSYPVGVFFATSSRKNTKSRLSSSNHLPWVEHGKLNGVLILV